MRPVPYQMTGAEVEGENPTMCCGWAEEGAWAVHGGSLGPRGLRHLAIVGKAGRAECEKTTSSGFDRAESRRTEAGTRQASAAWHRVVLSSLGTSPQAGLPFPVRCQKIVTR